MLSHCLLSFLLSELIVYPSAKVLPLLATWVASNLWKVRIIQSCREWRIFYINEQGKGRVKGMMTKDRPFQTAALTAGTGISGVWGSSQSPGRRSCWWTPASARRRVCWSYQDLPAYIYIRHVLMFNNVNWQFNEIIQNMKYVKTTLDMILSVSRFQLNLSSGLPSRGAMCLISLTQYSSINDHHCPSL